MSRVKALVAFTLFVASATGSAEAQSLRVSPVTIDLPPGAASVVLTVDTDKKEGVPVQARVLHWSSVNGEDKLEKTEDVVVSPPMLTLHAGSPSTLRLVRVAKTPVSGEETYRVLLDEIPNRKNLQAGTIALTIRQSLPVFFAGFDARPGSLTWKITQRDRKPVLEATNTGQKRVKITKLTATDEKSRNILKNGGLAYVLAGQTKFWELAEPAVGKAITITAESDAGPINASVNGGKGG